MDQQDHKETPRRAGRLRKVAVIVLLAVALGATGITVAYYALTAPVIPQEELQQLFAQARSYLRSATPERRAIGEELVAVLDTVPSPPEELDYCEEEERAALEAKWLAAAADSLGKIRAFAAKGPGAFDQETGPETDEVPTWIRSVRHVTQLVSYAAEASARENRMAQWLADLRLTCLLADTVEHRGSGLPRILGIKFRRLVCEEMLLRRHVLEDKTLLECIRLCEEQESQLQPIADVVWGDLLYAERIGKEGMGLDSFTDKLSRVRWESAALMAQLQLRCKEAMEKKPQQALLALRDMEQELRAEAELASKGRAVILWSYLSDRRTFYHKCLEDVATLRGTRIALALEGCKRARGAYPEQLSALVPDFLPALPLDPFANQQFVYRARDAGFILYALGPDQEDNGGCVNQNLSAAGEALLQGSSPGDDFIVVAEGQESSRAEIPVVAPKPSE